MFIPYQWIQAKELEISTFGDASVLDILMQFYGVLGVRFRNFGATIAFTNGWMYAAQTRTSTPIRLSIDNPFLIVAFIFQQHLEGLVIPKRKKKCQSTAN